MSLNRLLSVMEPGNAGVFFYTRGILQRLIQVRPGIQLDLAYSSCRDSPELYELVEQLQRRGGQAWDMRVGNAPQLRDFPVLLHLRKLIRHTRPDLIHAHSSKAGALVRFLALLPGSPPIVYTPNAYYGMGEPYKPASILFNLIEAVLGRVGKTINGSGDERRFGREFLKVPARRLVFIHHGIDLGKFRPATETERVQLRSQFQLPSERPLLVTLGRNAYQKNYPPLYAALEQLLSSSGPPFHFAHAGAGSAALAATLSPQARAHVHVFEHVKNVSDLLRSGNALIMTSRYESPSYAVLEGLASGVKVFLTRTPGFAGQAKLGFKEITWIEPDSSQAELTRRIVAALQQWSAADHPMPGEEQCRRARTWFDAEVQFAKTVRLFDYLVGSRSASSPLPVR